MSQRAIALVLGVTLACSSALAQAPAPKSEPKDPKTEKADALVGEGAKLGGAGRFEEAITRFKAAEAVLPRAIHLCNIGLAYTRLKRWPQALFYLDRCRAKHVGELPSWIDPRRNQLLDTLRAGEYVPVRIEVTPAQAVLTVSAFAADEVLEIPADVWLPAGSHQIVAKLDGFEAVERDVELRGKNPLRVEIEMEKAKPKPAGDGGGDGKPTVTEEVPPPRDDTLAYVALGGGGALVVTGVIFYVAAIGTTSDLEGLEDGPKRDDLISTLESRQALAFVFGGLGLAGAGLGTYLLLRPDAASDSAKVLVGPSGFSVRMDF